MTNSITTRPNQQLRICDLTDLDKVSDYAQQRNDQMKPMDIPDNLKRFELVTFENDQHAVKADDMMLNLTPRAFAQMCARIGVPGDFALRCPVDMRKEMVDYWMKESQKEVLFRTVDDIFYPDTVRAVVSNQYQPLDDVTILPMIRDVIADMPVEIKHTSFEDEYTHLRIVFPKQEAQPRKGDIVQTGLHITNSEVGARAFRINAFVYRLVCANGLVRGEYAEKTVFRHVGDPARLLDNVAQAIKNATQGSTLLMQQLARTVDTKFTVAEDGQKMLERMMEDRVLNKRQFENSTHFYSVRGDHTLYGVINAITEAAQRENGMEPRYQMEQVAARLLKAA